MRSEGMNMLTRLLAISIVSAACAGSPTPSTGLKIESVPGQPPKVRLLLDKEEAFRLSRVGVTDPSSPSGLTDRIRYRTALEQYTAAVLKGNGLCRDGYRDLDIEGAGSPYSLAITVVCLAP
jgi:hypothetical protein